eukprot:11688439-Karenia_brevis.AAC.1
MRKQVLLALEKLSPIFRAQGITPMGSRAASVASAEDMEQDVTGDAVVQDPYTMVGEEPPTMQSQDSTCVLKLGVKRRVRGKQPVSEKNGFAAPETRQ